MIGPHGVVKNPTLDQSGREIPASSPTRLAGVAGSEMKPFRRFAADRAMRTNVVIVSTPSLAFFTPSLAFLPRLVEYIDSLEPPICGISGDGRGV